MPDVYIIQSYYKNSAMMAGIEGVFSSYEKAEDELEKYYSIPHFSNRCDFAIVRWGVD